MLIIRYAGSFRQYQLVRGHIVKVEYQGYISQKMAVSGELVFHKHFFFLALLLKASKAYVMAWCPSSVR